MKTKCLTLLSAICLRALVVGACFIVPSADLLAQPLRDLFRQVAPSVVVVHAQKRNQTQNNLDQPLAGQSIGSGVVVAPEGKVLTAAHVVQAADSITVEFIRGQRIPARVLAAAPFADVALLQLENVPADMTVARLGDSSLIEVGDQVFTIGAPYGASHSLSVGWVSARRATENAVENLTALETLQVDAALFEGNSGGPVFNFSGEVIGIVSHALAKVGNTTGIGFAVTSNIARKLVLEDKRVWLGVEGWLIEGPLAEAFNLPQPAGLLVQSVATGSIGERLGLREGRLTLTVGELNLLAGGDIIVEMLGLPIIPDPRVLNDVQQRLNQLRAGDQLQVKILRRGRMMDLTTVITP